MRAALINTGTELLLGDVQDAHLTFIAREIFADSLGLELHQDAQLLASLRQKLKIRGIKWAAGIVRQTDVPVGAQVLPNENGSAPGLYLKANINPRIPSPHVFVMPGPPRELQPMFRKFVLPILHSIVRAPLSVERRLYRIAGVGETLVEETIGEKILTIPGIELGYCARPGEVEVRIVGEPRAIKQADAIIQSSLRVSIFSTADETLEEVIVKLLTKRNQTLATAESCTGGLIANRVTNVPGASRVF